MNFPKLIQDLIDDFAALPGIGNKSAERLVFYLLKNNHKINLNKFAKNLEQINQQIKICPICGNYTLGRQCGICSDQHRNQSLICVVAEPQDVYYINETHAFNGLYHILGGNLSPAENITPNKLNIKSLLTRLQDKKIKEVILALNPTVEGESTILYLNKTIKEKYPHITVTRLSRGLPMGGDLEYADEITLSSAIKNRNKI